MKKTIFYFILRLIIVSGLIILFVKLNALFKSPKTNFTVEPNMPIDISDLIIVDRPQAGEIIDSPATISGRARGSWFFEGSFPIKIIDVNGELLGAGVAEAQSNWMTNDFVDFRAVISFKSPATSSGFVVLHNDNPSGLPDKDKELKIPIVFSGNPATSTVRTVKFFYYDSRLDQDETGNVLCSQRGLVAWDHDIPFTATPIKDTIEEFLSTPLPEEAAAAGLSSEFPLSGVFLESLNLDKNSGLLIIRLSDQYNQTGGGACRVSILKSQLEAVAKQFPEVKEVKFEPETLFQP